MKRWGRVGTAGLAPRYKLARTPRRNGAFTPIELIWQAGPLLQSTNVTGPNLPVAGATAPYYTVKPGAGNKFYRVQL